MCPASSTFGKQDDDDDEFGTNNDETNKHFKLGKKLLKVQHRELLISNRRNIYCTFTNTQLAQHLSSLSTTTTVGFLSKKNSAQKFKSQQKFRELKSHGKRRISPPIYEQFRSLSTLVARLDMEWNDDLTIIIETIKRFRKLLATSQIDGPIDQVIQSGAVEYCVKYLDLKEIHKYFNKVLHELQYEASWAITNIVSSSTSEHTKYVVDLGCIPKLMHLLRVENDNLKDHCLLALGNISGDSSAIMRDIVLDHGPMPIVLVQILENTTDENVKRTALWTVKNLLRTPTPSWEIISATIPILKNLICKSSDENIAINACWAIVYISNGPNERIQAIIEHEDLVRKLIELVNHNNPEVQTPALRSICNLVTGDDYQTSFVLKCGLPEKLKKIINHPIIDIRKQALWTLSNITAGTAEQIQMVINAGIIRKIISLLLIISINTS